MDVNKPLSTADGKRSRRNILAELSPSLSNTFLPPSSRSPSPRFETIFLTRPYCLVSPPTISQIFFFHSFVVWCGSLQHNTAPSHREFALTPAGGRSKMQPTAKILLSHPHRSFAFDHLLSNVDCESFVCFHSPHVCFRPQDGLRSAFAGLRSLRPFLSLFSFGTSLHLLSPVLTRSRYCPAPVRVLGIATSGSPLIPKFKLEPLILLLGRLFVLHLE